MRKHEIPDQQKEFRPCQGCSHAEFAHEGDGHQDRGKYPDACNLCSCKAFVGATVRGDMTPDLKR
jgi:hypothetical protein